MQTQRMPALRSHDPFRSLLQSFFADVAPEVPNNAMRPRIDVTETEAAYVLAFELPGIALEDIDVQVQERTLTVTAERRATEPKEGTRRHRVEMRYGRFTRTIELPENVGAEQVEATLDKGVLTVTVPKRPESRPTKVQIKTA